jgi:hypothetical protein
MRAGLSQPPLDDDRDLKTHHTLVIGIVEPTVLSEIEGMIRGVRADGAAL